MGANLTTEQKARNLERRLLALSGLELDQSLMVEDIQIDFRGQNYIHTVKCGFEQSSHSKQKLVMLHGYAGSNVFFYRILKELSKIYEVYCIDLLGMGLSSRPQFDCENTEDSINFFVESIEQWRIKLGLEKFVLCGHSFGGYMAGQYAVKYQSRVSKLLLLSPLGFTKREITISTPEEEKVKYEKKTFLQKQLHKIKLSFWRDKMTFSQIANKYAWAFGFIFRRWLTKRFRLNSDIGELLWDYLLEIWRLPVSSEKAIYYIINQDIIAFHALEESVIDLEIPVCVYYGDKDWMDDLGARRLHSNNQKSDFELFYVDDCGHQVTMENPEEFLKHFWRRHSIENSAKELLVSEVN